MSEYKISVIIPVYNVEAYLDECIESLINQTFNNFEAIFINDGSLDASKEIIQKYCNDRSNFTLINQKNSGSAGGPRNIGINYANGEYIFFLDPDDRLPYTAFEYLYKAIEKSKAQIACGSYWNFKNKSAWSPAHVIKDIYYEERVTDFRNALELSKNFIPCNKLYNKEFLLKNNILFDENLRYGEDRSFVLKSYIYADKIHIIPECVYYYRMRESTTNISAIQSYELETFKESILACKYDEILLKIRHYKPYDIYGKERIYHDFIRFIDYYAKNSETISASNWKEIFEISNEYIKLFDGNFDKLSYSQKIKVKFILNKDIEGLVDFINQKRNIFKIIKNKGKVYTKDLNFLNRNKVTWHEKVNSSDLVPFYKIEQMTIKDNFMFFKGWAYIHRYKMSNKECLKKILVFKNGDKEAEILLQNLKRFDVSLEKGKGIYNYLYSGFENKINLKDILKIVDSDNSLVKMYLKLEIDDTLYCESYIDELDLYDCMNSGYSSNNIRQRVEKVYYYNTYLKIIGWSFVNRYFQNNSDTYLILKNIDTKKECYYKVDICSDIKSEMNNFLQYKDIPCWNVDINYNTLENGKYKLYIEIKNDKVCLRSELKYPCLSLAKQRRRLDLGYVAFCKKYRLEFTTNEHIRSNGTFLFSVQDVDNKEYIQNGGYIPIIGTKGDYYDIKTEDLLLRGIAVSHRNLSFNGTYINNESHFKQCMIIEDKNKNKYNCDSKLSSIINIEKLPGMWNNEFIYMFKSGKYSIKIVIENEENRKVFEKYRLSNGLLNNVRVWNSKHYVGKSKIQFVKNQDLLNSKLYSIDMYVDKSYKNLFCGIAIKILRRLKTIFSTMLIKIKLIQKIRSKNILIRSRIYIMLYRLFSILPINKNKITLVSYKEKMPVDYVIFYNTIKEKYPNIDIKFIGGNNKAMSQYIKMAFRFATSKNIIIDSYYRHLYNVKHRNKTNFVQIWHASGIFKRFGLLAVGKNQANSEKFEINAHHYYTHVVVSGECIIKPYSEAFGISESRVYSLGVSRTDEFFNEENKEKIIEKLYNIYPMIKNKKVILYAPTFRGDDNERKSFRNQLDFKIMYKLRAEGYILLCKMHPSVTEPIVIPNIYKDFVYDVTQYPSINDLFFVTDILITDYSSSIFEFSLLRKPMIFFAYDLDKYLNERGFYYDYEKFVPGPICKETNEVFECINNIDKVKFNYDDFVNKYMNKCDGHATERLIKLVMNEEE